MKTIEQIYQERCANPSDINEHLPVLRGLANGMNTVVEFGVRDGNSTAAFLSAGVKLLSVDLERDARLKELEDAYFLTDGPEQWKLMIADDLEIDIPECDMLFIDSNHTSAHLRKELEKHAGKVRKIIALHDTTTFWNWDEFRNEEGMVTAIIEFLESHPEWGIELELKNCNGLMVWRKKA